MSPTIHGPEAVMPAEGHADEDRRTPELFTDDQWRKLAGYLALPPRQRQIARLLCRGCTNCQIAARLGISPHTVRTHLRALFERFEVRDRLGIIIRLVRVDRKLSQRPHQDESSCPDPPGRAY